MNLNIKREQLKLAYEWKQIDVVTKSIITNERDWQVKKLTDEYMITLLYVENWIERSIRKSSQGKSSRFRSIVSWSWFSIEWFIWK
jgi:hypothetical protein